MFARKFILVPKNVWEAMNINCVGISTSDYHTVPVREAVQSLKPLVFTNLCGVIEITLLDGWS